MASKTTSTTRTTRKPKDGEAGPAGLAAVLPKATTRKPKAAAAKPKANGNPGGRPKAEGLDDTTRAELVALTAELNELRAKADAKEKELGKVAARAFDAKMGLTSIGQATGRQVTAVQRLIKKGRA